MLFNRWRKLAKHLEAHGRRAPATVVEIASWGSEHHAEGYGPEDAIRDLTEGDAGRSLAPDSAHYSVRKARIRVRPADGEQFEVERKMRFGDWGRYVPKAGDEIEVIYDPDDHEKLLVAPPTAEEEALRTAEALGKADIGLTIGGTGYRGTGKRPTDEQMAEYQQQMDAAQSMLEQAQKFMSGDQNPGDDSTKKSGSERDS